jgi:thiol-disulfide isomerase/thioredoxin
VPALAKPWYVVPGGDGGVLLYTIQKSWATSAVMAWVQITDAFVQPEWASADPPNRPSDPDANWLKWVLTKTEAYTLARDIRDRQAKYEFASGIYHRRMAEDILRATLFGVVKGGLKGMEPGTDAKPTLYFLYAPGCPACKAMKPVVGDFYRANRDRVNVRPIDLSRVEWKAKAWEPEVTPTLILRRPDGTLSKPLEGYEPGKPRETFKSWFLTAMRPHGA